jgi:hypothetical protein
MMASRVQEGGGGMGSSGSSRMKLAKQPAKAKVASRKVADEASKKAKQRAVILSLRKR